MPYTGTWEVTLLDEQNNCPAELLLSGAWVPANGSQHVLTFSTLEAVPLDLHKVVAPVEVEETPEFFSVTTGDYNQYEIIPTIQTQPYLYRYAILEEQYIVLEYTQTLALSDCVLTATYNLTLISSDTSTTGETTSTEDAASAPLNNWALGGDSSDPVFLFDDPAAPDGALCGTDQAQGETWFFSADPAFVSEVNASYGQTLSYDIRISEGNTDNAYDDFDVELVVGNGIVLHYTSGSYPTSEWTHFEVKLDETAGWVDVDGFMDTSDPALFAQMIQDVTQVNIRGEYIVGDDTACITNVQIGDGTTTATTNSTFIDLSGWQPGDITTPELFFEFAEAPDGALCTSEQAPGILWTIDADQAFVSQLNASYGQIIRFDTRTLSEHMTEPYTDMNIELVIGNGIVLQYSFEATSQNEWTHYDVELSETAGWVDVDGFMDTSDPALFAQMVQDITQFRIYGTHMQDTGSTCLANVQIGSNATNNTGTDATQPAQPAAGPQLQSGFYETVIADVAEGCTSYLPLGAVQYINVEFSYMDQDATLAMLIEGVPQPVIFFATADAAVYQAEGDGLGMLSIVSPVQFTLQHVSDGCQTTTQATLADA
ncbi:laminin B domain-containing protein [Phototrophicus methaneseepsis]|uniref:laminin B domain-containing protein n=1 Tax=Phototrophicus methaneseepsis TaxID=2710758 RepID=UPI001E54E48C|nr:laminin B domain-containing protein [Phototrophicus methaneseepsis]